MTSDVDKALSTAVSNKIVDQVIPSMSPQPRASSGFLDTGFAIAFAQKLPEQLATLVDVFFTRLGPDRTGKLVDGIQQKFLGGGEAGGAKQLTEDDIISALDPDNPAHLHQYMAYKNLNDPDIAKRTLIAERDNVRKRMYSGTSGTGAGMGGGIAGAGIGTGTDAGLIQTLEGQNAVLKEIVQGRVEDRKVMEALFNEIAKLKQERESEWLGGSFNVDSVSDGKRVDELGLPKKEKVLKEIKSKDLPVESEESKDLVSAVKLEDVVIKDVSKKVGDEDGSVEMESNKVEDESVDNKKTTVIMKKGGSKPKFE